jgi:hypothetical protein
MTSLVKHLTIHHSRDLPSAHTLSSPDTQDTLLHALSLIRRRIQHQFAEIFNHVHHSAGVVGLEGGGMEGSEDGGQKAPVKEERVAARIRVRVRVRVKWLFFFSTILLPHCPLLPLHPLSHPTLTPAPLNLHPSTLNLQPSTLSPDHQNDSQLWCNVLGGPRECPPSPSLCLPCLL